MELEAAAAHAALRAFSKTGSFPVSLRQCLSLECPVQSLVLVVMRCAGMSWGKKMQQYLRREDFNSQRKKDRPTQLSHQAEFIWYS